MTKFEPVLSSDDITSVVFPCDWSENKDQQIACIIARELEQAVLAKLAEREPVCYLLGDPKNNPQVLSIEFMSRPNTFESGAVITPVYAHPETQRSDPSAWRVGGRLFSNKSDAEKVGKASGVGVVPLYGIPQPPGPQGGPTVRGMSLDETSAYIEKLEAEYVAKGADAYNFVCAQLEQWQEQRGNEGSDPGPVGTLSGWMDWAQEEIEKSTLTCDKGPVDGLRPCPLCGSKAKEVDRFNSNTVTCTHCKLQVKQTSMGEGDAAEKWNTRVAYEPTMFWNKDCTEWSEESIHNVLVSADAQVGDVVVVQRAVLLNDATVTVTGYDEEENEYTYNEVSDG